jgi:ubiquinone/menaquinone biosynthesis C-methylase UbiE
MGESADKSTMEINSKLLEVFFEVQRGLPRQGPGSDDSTIYALKLCSELPDNPTVLDIGCGPGMQTVALAKACSGRIIATDTCDEYLDELRQRVRQASLSDRVEVKNADMVELGLPEESIDLIWCEGAAYIMGVSAALQAWRPLLRDEGYLAFTELVWLEANPVATVAEFFRDEYPAMTSTEAIKEKVREGGYELVGDFTLPDSAWWIDYYAPLEAKLPSLRQKYVGDEEALSVIATTEAEIDMRRRFCQSYGYHFFIVRIVGK